MLFSGWPWGYSPTVGFVLTPRYDGGVRVNPKETPQQTKTPNLYEVGVFVGCGVDLRLNTNPTSGWLWGYSPTSSGSQTIFYHYIITSVVPLIFSYSTIFLRLTLFCFIVVVVVVVATVVITII